jgi:hypothetical protein
MKVIAKLGSLLALWILTISVRGWLFWICLIITVVASYLVIGRFIYHNSTPWRRIYFPLINRYAYLGGFHLEIAEQTGAEFSPLTPLFMLLKDYLKDVERTQLEEMLRKWKAEFDDFQCRRVFQEILSRRNLDPEKVNEKVEHIRQTIFEAKNYNGSLVRYVIGQVIERKLGPEQKKKYWEAVLSGDVV